MTSYTIPEEIIGLPLFVPSDNDYFEITPGALPNGDSALRVRGDLSINYRAFCKLPVTSPNIGANLTSWAFSCWIKVPSGNGGGAAFRFSRVLFAAMNINNTINTPNANCFMGMSALDSNSNTGLNFSRATTTSGTSEFSVLSGIRNNTWKLICVNVPNTVQTGTMHVDDNPVAVSSDTQVGGTNPTGPLYLCIGNYALTGTSLAFADDWSIAKMAFYDHHLSQAERDLLFGAMTVSNAVTCSVDVAPGQADPATGGFVTFRVVFSESVSGFLNTDVNISGTAGANSCFITGGVNTYDVSVSGMTTPGTVVIDIPAGVVAGVSGGTNLDSIAIDNSVDWS